MTTSLPIRLAALFFAVAVTESSLSAPALAGGPWFHHGYGKSNVIVVQPSNVQTAVMVPATTQFLQAPSVNRLQVGAMPGYQIMPMNVGVGATPGMTLQAGGAPVTYYVVQQGSSPVVSPTSVGAAGDTSGPVTDADYQYLAAGFGGRFTIIQSLEKKLSAAYDRASGQNLSNDDLVSFLTGVANQFLNQTGFGFVLDPVVDGIIKRLINKIIQNKQTQPTNGGPSNGGTNPPQTPSIPSGGATFQINGRITLTPVNGGGNPPNGNPNGPPSGPPSNGNNNLPTALTPDEPGLAPPAPPAPSSNQ
jgi:hypothetical protein